MARARKTRVAEDAWLRRPLPELDDRLCNGCGWCVAICPVDSLAMSGPTPWLARPAACVSCGLCAAVCPTQAISMKTANPIV